ncbi:hypothetical protein HMPREF1039_1260, partial [Megasphaera lornae]
MNKIYRVIFNKARGIYQVVSELVHSQSKSKSGKRGGIVVKTTGAAMLAVVLLTSAGGINMASASSNASVTTPDSTPANPKIEELLQQLNALSGRVGGNEGKIDKNAKDIVAITKQGGTIDTAIAALKNGEIKSNKEAIAALTGETGAITKNSRAIQTNAEAIAALTKEGGAVTANKTAIEKNTTALNNLNAPEGTLAKMQEQITANKGKSENNAKVIADITKQGGKIDTAITTLNRLNAPDGT